MTLRIDESTLDVDLLIQTWTAIALQVGIKLGAKYLGLTQSENPNSIDVELIFCKQCERT